VILSTFSKALVFMGLVAVGQTAAAQQQDAEVMKVVTTLFDGMKAKDTTKMRSVFAPGARLMTAAVRNGAPAVSTTPIDGWIASIGRATASIEEKTFSPEVRVDGNLATVWTRYEFWANGARSHCGYDSIQLALLPDGWKIIHLADSHRTNCG
jgi:hypothetical protein